MDISNFTQGGLGGAIACLLMKYGNQLIKGVFNRIKRFKYQRGNTTIEIDFKDDNTPKIEN